MAYTLCHSSGQSCTLDIGVCGVCFLASFLQSEISNLVLGPCFLCILIFHPGKSKNTYFGISDGYRVHSSTALNAVKYTEQLPET